VDPPRTTHARLRWLPSLVIAALATGVGNAAHVSATLGYPWGSWLGHWELAVHQRRLGQASPATSSEIVLVGIEPETPQRLHPQRPVLPLPRSDHARLIRALRDAGCLTLVLDLTFEEPGAPAQDAALRAALRTSSPMSVSLASGYDSAKSRPDGDAPTGWRYRFRQPAVLPRPVPENVVVASAAPFKPDNLLAGAVLLQPDDASGGILPHLSLSAVLQRYQVRPGSAGWSQERSLVTAGKMAWPVGGDGELLVRWTDGSQGFQYAEYAQALEMLAVPEGKRLFRGKIAIVGDRTGQDSHASPVGAMHGMEFVAQMVNTLLLPGLSVPAWWGLPAQVGWGFSLALVASISMRRRTLHALLGAGGALGAALLAPSLALSWWQGGLHTVAPSLAVALAIAGTLVWESRRTLRLAKRFTPTYIKDGDAPTWSEEATVMFVDLADSTSITEKLGSEATSGLLTRLLGAVSGEILRHGGDIERTTGDGLLAVFRARTGRHHARRCAEASLAVQALADADRGDYEEKYGISLRLTIGMETGIITCSMVRAGEREELSSIGPGVNLAARLQGACREVGARILLGPAARSLVQSWLPTIPLGAVQLKGLPDPTPVYTLAAVHEHAAPGGAS
jgi:adenylate cyclase